jgi:hypothetical protein
MAIPVGYRQGKMCRNTAAMISKIVAAVIFYCAEEGEKMPEKSVGGHTLNEQEQHLLAMIREMKYGELHIFISDGKPVRVEEMIKSIKL